MRSSIARRLGMDIGGLTPADRNVEGVVEMMLDATQSYDEPLTEETAVRLACGAVSDRPQRHDENHRRRVARRQVRPDAGRLRADRARSASTMKRRAHRGSKQEMKTFLDWFNKDDATDLGAESRRSRICGS